MPDAAVPNDPDGSPAGADATPSPRPYGTAQGLPPPATTPFGSATGTGSTSAGSGGQSDVRSDAAPGNPYGPPPASSAPAPGGPPPPPRYGTGGPPTPPAYGWSEQPAPVGPQPQPPAVRDEDLARARRLARLGLYNAVIGVILSLVFFPVGFVFDIVAIVLGVRARRAAVRAQQGEGAGVVTVVLGGIGLSLAIALGSMLAVFWTEIRTYQSCSSGAITHSARTVCETALSDDVRRRIGMD